MRADRCHRGACRATLLLDPESDCLSVVPMEKKPKPAATRKQRLAKALKANLLKRKAQARSRKPAKPAGD